MDYKKIIKSREMREKILDILSFIPDKQMLQLQYFIKTNRMLDLKNPKRFTEKLQWYKLYYRDPLMIQCVDKYDVREYVSSKGLGNILIPCYGVYHSPDEIDWAMLPDQFVIKDTLGGGGNSVVIVKDKNSEDLVALKKKAQQWVSVDARRKGGGREWPYYSGKKHRIIVEEYMYADESEGGLIDYKFFCFGGKIAFMYVISDRTIGGKACFGIFDDNMNRLNVERLGEYPQKRNIQKPKNFEVMKNIAHCLSKDFPEARVDLYNINSEIKFGEITFFNASGYMQFRPDSFDLEMGDRFILPRPKILIE